MTLDHMILEKVEDFSRNGDRVVAVILDLFSKWLEGHAAKTNSAETTQAAITRFLGPWVAPDYVYSDNSREIKKALENLSWSDRHDTSTPNRPETNGTIERTVRKVKEGMRALLLQAGANPEWWADAMRCFCFLHNVSDVLWDGQTAYEKRFDDFYHGPTYPFMCEVKYKPSSPKIINQMHPFGAKTLSGLFIGYYQQPGGLWGGDLLVVDWQEFDRAERVAEVPIRRIKAKEVFPQLYNGKYRFPLAEGALRQPQNSVHTHRHARNRHVRSELEWTKPNMSEDIEDESTPLPEESSSAPRRDDDDEEIPEEKGDSEDHTGEFREFDWLEDEDRHEREK
jgi:transposase InsO family protein